MQEVRALNQLLKVISDFRDSHENIVGNLTVAKREMEKVIFQARLIVGGAVLLMTKAVSSSVKK